MTSPEKRIRKWLRLYPRAYREKRGEELVATLLEKAHDDPRLPYREIAAVTHHAGVMRLRQLRLVSAALCLVLVGAVVGAGVGWLNGSTAYVATTTTLPAGISGSAPTSPTISVELRAYVSQFETFEGTSAARGTIDRHLAAPYPTCSVTSVAAIGERGVKLSCSSASAASAQTAMSNHSEVLLSVIERDRKIVYAEAEVRTLQLVASIQPILSRIRFQLATTSKLILRGGLSHLLVTKQHELSGAEAKVVLLRAETMNPGGLGSGTTSPPTAVTERDIKVPLEIGAAIGLLIGVALGTANRQRRMRGPVHA